MSRPRVPASENLSVTIGARVPAAVAAKWRAEAARSGVCISDWLRAAVDPGRVRLTGLKTPGRRIARRQADPLLVEAIGRYGNNLNQLARLANTGALSGEPVDVLQVLVVIERHLHELLNRHVMPIGKAGAVEAES